MAAGSQLMGRVTNAGMAGYQGYSAISGLGTMPTMGAKPGGLNTGPMGEPLIDHYRNDVIGGRGAFAIMAEGRDEFAPAILKKMILEIAEVPDGRVRID